MLQLSAKGKDRSAAESRAPQRVKPKRTIEFHRIGAAEEMDADDTGGPEIVQITFHQAPAYSHAPITRVDVDMQMSGIVASIERLSSREKRPSAFWAESKRAPAKSHERRDYGDIGQGQFARATAKSLATLLCEQIFVSRDSP